MNTQRIDGPGVNIVVELPSEYQAVMPGALERERAMRRVKELASAIPYAHQRSDDMMRGLQGPYSTLASFGGGPRFNATYFVQTNG